MRRLSPQNVILDILVTHVAAVRAQNSKDGNPKTAELERKSILASFLR